MYSAFSWVLQPSLSWLGLMFKFHALWYAGGQTRTIITVPFGRLIWFLFYKIVLQKQTMWKRVNWFLFCVSMHMTMPFHSQLLLESFVKGRETHSVLSGTAAIEMSITLIRVAELQRGRWSLDQRVEPLASDKKDCHNIAPSGIGRRNSVI